MEKGGISGMAGNPHCEHELQKIWPIMCNFKFLSRIIRLYPLHFHLGETFIMCPNYKCILHWKYVMSLKNKGEFQVRSPRSPRGDLCRTAIPGRSLQAPVPSVLINP